MSLIIPSKHMSNLVGYSGENKCTTIAIRIDKIVKDYGLDGEWTVFIKRKGDAEPYQLSADRLFFDDRHLMFRIESLDIQNGSGEFQIRYSVDKIVKNCEIYKFYTKSSIKERQE